MLKIIFEKSLAEPGKEFSALSLPEHIHGYRWILHPDQQRQIAYHKLLLSSLEFSGDVKKGRHDYVLTGKALETKSKFESDEKRHQESVNQSKAIKWLTLVLIIVGFLQAYVIYQD